MYRTAIVDECGDIMYWCSELTLEQEIAILNEYQEWTKRAIYIDC